MIDFKLPRRSFLCTLMQASASLFVLTLPGCSMPGGIRQQARALTWWIPASTSTRALGRRYLDLARKERNLPALVNLAVHDIEETEFLRLMKDDPDTLRQRLHASHLEDFRHGHTIHIDRWVLSRTEARLCAIVTLFHERG